MAERAPVRIYPLRDGTLVAFDGQVDYAAILTAFAQLLDQAPDSFAGSSLIIDIGPRTLTTDQLLDLEAMARRSLGSRVLQIVSGEVAEILAEDGSYRGSANFEAAPSRGGSAVGGPGRNEPVPTPWQRTLHHESESSGSGAAVAAGQASSTAYILGRTVRSGQRITCEGSIVILGDVNPGAEVIATGDVIVMGYLRGLAHAGAACDQHIARIVALQLAPTQLRIGNLVGRPPEQADGGPIYPEVAYVADRRIVVEPLLARHRGDSRTNGIGVGGRQGAARNRGEWV